MPAKFKAATRLSNTGRVGTAAITTATRGLAISAGRHSHANPSPTRTGDGRVIEARERPGLGLRVMRDGVPRPMRNSQTSVVSSESRHPKRSRSLAWSQTRPPSASAPEGGTASGWARSEGKSSSEKMSWPFDSTATASRWPSSLTANASTFRAGAWMVLRARPWTTTASTPIVARSASVSTYTVRPSGENRG